MASRAEYRVFSIAKANQAVRELRRTLPALRRAVRNVEHMEERLEVLDLICNRAVSADNPDLKEYLSTRERYHRVLAELSSKLATLDEKGYLLRDLEKGVVHFVARRAGEHVLLCWREGEPEVAHWLPLNGQGAPDEQQRQRIDKNDEF
ncbi:MAG: hypothetical protein DHS20C21_01210 [Gemmatimonadota bacterium]|nr:MAG: hypothetical protein DHS20C21_01210 [Gemmatimonadota bacterium]